MSTIKKMHHYIPQLILRNFSPNNKYIHIYNHEKQKIYPQGLDSAFAEKHLNLVIDTEGKKHHNLLEDFFSDNFERKIGVTLKKIKENVESKSIEPLHLLRSEDWLEILQFTLATGMRNPYELNKIRYSGLLHLHGNFLIHQMIEKGKFDTSVLFGYKRQNLIFDIFEKFDKNIMLCKDLNITILYHNIEDQYFLLPDSGLVMLFNGMKLAADDLQMILPISSKAVIIFCRNSPTNFLAREIGKEEIHNLNLLFAQNFYECIGCEDENFLSHFVKNLKTLIKPHKKYPEHITKYDLKRLKKIILSNNRKIKDSGRFITHVDMDMNFNIYTKYYKDEEGYTNLIG